MWKTTLNGKEITDTYENIIKIFAERGIIGGELTRVK